MKQLFTVIALLCAATTFADGLLVLARDGRTRGLVAGGRNKVEKP